MLFFCCPPCHMSLFHLYCNNCSCSLCLYLLLWALQFICLYCYPFVQFFSYLDINLYLEISFLSSSSKWLQNSILIFIYLALLDVAPHSSFKALPTVYVCPCKFIFTQSFSTSLTHSFFQVMINYVMSFYLLMWKLNLIHTPTKWKEF